ncbi:hypothetical protein HBB16_02060 [Pseudonocardia sp. MCCB 268]|nr:hypothetical protein [Pseudonocardia cytotoxica]
MSLSRVGASSGRRASGLLTARRPGWWPEVLRCSCMVSTPSSSADLSAPAL